MAYQLIVLDRASLSVCQTSFHCEVVLGHIPLLSASAQRSCAAAPLCHSPLLSPHPHPPVGACTGSEVPIPGTPAESPVFSKLLINTKSSQRFNTNGIVSGAGQDYCWIYLHVWWLGTWYEYWDCARRSWAPRFDWWLWEWWHTWQRSGTWGGWEKNRINQQAQIKDRNNLADVRREHTPTYLPMRGTESDVSGTFWAIRKRKTVWASNNEMDTVNFCPPAVKRTTET